VISNDLVRDPEVAYNGLEVLDSRGLVDANHHYCNRPHCGLDDGDVRVAVATNDSSEGTQNIHPQTMKGQDGGIMCSACTLVWICLA
jgi:hypothetical protein